MLPSFSGKYSDVFPTRVLADRGSLLGHCGLGHHGFHDATAATMLWTPQPSSWFSRAVTAFSSGRWALEREGDAAGIDMDVSYTPGIRDGVLPTEMQILGDVEHAMQLEREEGERGGLDSNLPAYQRFLECVQGLMDKLRGAREKADQLDHIGAVNMLTDLLGEFSSSSSNIMHDCLVSPDVLRSLVEERHTLLEETEKMCFVCKTGKLGKMCLNCGAAYFCSKKCQRSGWQSNEHRPYCKLGSRVKGSIEAEEARLKSLTPLREELLASLTEPWHAACSSTPATDGASSFPRVGDGYMRTSDMQTGELKCLSPYPLCPYVPAQLFFDPYSRVDRAFHEAAKRVANLAQLSLSWVVLDREHCSHCRELCAHGCGTLDEGGDLSPADCYGCFDRNKFRVAGPPPKSPATYPPFRKFQACMETWVNNKTRTRGNADSVYGALFCLFSICRMLAAHALPHCLDVLPPDQPYFSSEYYHDYTLFVTEAAALGSIIRAGLEQGTWMTIEYAQPELVEAIYSRTPSCRARVG